MGSDLSPDDGSDSRAALFERPREHKIIIGQMPVLGGRNEPDGWVI